MKKLACFLLIVIFLFAFSACKNDKLDDSVTSSNISNVNSEYSTSSLDNTVSTPSNDNNSVSSQNNSVNASQNFAPITDSGFSKGNGTQTNPYVIETPQQLVHFSEKINNGELNNGVHFALGANIDMTGVEFTPIGNNTHRFSARFDGKGFTISNLTPKLIYEEKSNNGNYICGFFGAVENAEIKNLCLENVNITYTYESDYYSEIGILAASVYTTRECKITNCVVNGNINVETDNLQAGGIMGDIYIYEGAKFEFSRVQSKTNLQVRSNSVTAGAICGSFLGRGEETFSDICVESNILHSSTYKAYVGAFGGATNMKGKMNVSNCFIKINTNKKYNDYVHPLIGGIINSYQPSGVFNFKNIFGFADSCSKLYEITSENPVKEENCSFTNTLPSNCNFDTNIWDITDPASPFIKFNFS